MRNGFRHSFAARTSRVLTSLGAPALVGLSALIAGCGSNDNTGNAPPPLTSGPTATVTAANNFSSTSTLTIPPVSVPPGADLNVCWSTLTTDIQGHTVDPKKDINDVSFIHVVSSSAQDTANLLNDGALDPKTNINGDWEKQFPTGTDDTCVHLSDLVTVPEGPSAPPLDPKNDFKTDNTVTDLMVFASGTAIGYGARTMVILQPDPSATTTDVTIDNSTATLAYSGTFGTPLPIAKDGSERVDWSGVAKGGAGQTIGRHDVDSILIGFYKDMQPSDLQTHFLNLAQPDNTDPGSPTLSWELAVDPGTQNVSLVGAKGRGTESAFASFDSQGDTGTWLMGMFCSNCQNPAPVIVTLLDPQ